jgi:GNAT superfamily N-acetyltransferase
MAGTLRAILHAAAQVPPPLFKYSPAPTRHRLHPGLLLLASGPSEGGAGQHAALLFEPVTPEQFFVWTTAFFGAGHAFSVTVEAKIAEPVEAALQRQGWQLAEEEPALVLAQIPSILPAPPPELAIVRVQDEPALAAFRSITRMAPATIPSLVAATDPAVALLVGSLDGEPVTTGRLSCLGTVAEVNSVTTKPGYERQGYGTAMTWAVLAEGAERGCVSAILTATTMGFPLYVRMGFEPVAVYRMYLPGTPSGGQDPGETLS